MVLIPELFETPYFCAVQNHDYFQLARPLADHPTIEHFRRVAAELGVVIPVSVFERAGPALFNSAVVIDADGAIVGHYRKSHIPQAPGYEEKYYFSPGDTGFKPIDTAYGKLGNRGVLGSVVSGGGPLPRSAGRGVSHVSHRHRQRAQACRPGFNGALAHRDARARGGEHGSRWSRPTELDPNRWRVCR